jgi:hypothetical protein
MDTQTHDAHAIAKVATSVTAYAIVRHAYFEGFTV